MITHKGTQIIKTERLILRPFSVDDADDMFNNWASDREVVRYLAWNVHENIAHTRRSIISFYLGYENYENYHWGICLDDDRVIGSISMECNDVAKRAEAEFCIGRAYWNKGYMTEALDAAVRFMFQDIGMNRLQAYHKSKNPASGRVMQKCGMRFEGTLREYGYDGNGVLHDCDMYGILARDIKK